MCFKVISGYFAFIVIAVVIGSCATGTNNSDNEEPRWKFIADFGEEPITELHVDETQENLMITSENYFGNIGIGSVSPNTMELLQTPSHDCFRYVPYITDQHYFYCNSNGDLLHIGNSVTGEYIDAIPIEEIVEEENLPAKYTRSSDKYNSNHMVYHDGLYMISIRHEAVSQDDWLYFGEFEFSDEGVCFNTFSKVCSYEDPPQATVMVRYNYYYGDHFWQYRTDNFSPNVCAVNEVDLNPVYTTFIPAITGIYEYYDYALGFFEVYIKKSFDNGFTWEDWLMMNAPWRHVEIAGVNVMFFSYNLGTMDFEQMETGNLEIGELHGHPIYNLEEFDNKVYAGTRDGLYYCNLDEFFIPMPENHKTKEGKVKIEVTAQK